MGAPAYNDYNDDSENDARPEPATQRRFGVIQGGGEGDGIPSGDLHSVDNPRKDIQAKEESMADANQDPMHSEKKMLEDNTDWPYSSNVDIADKPPKKGPGTWFKRNKGKVAGGVVAISLLGGLFSVTVPLKLQGIMSMVQETGFGRIQGYVQKRAKKIVLEAMMRRFDVLPEGRPVVQEGSLMKSIVKTMAATKYEERLLKQGIKIERPDGWSGIRVTIIDDTTDLAKKLSETAFKNVDTLELAIDNIKQGKVIMNQIVKADLGAWGFLTRGKLVRWMVRFFGLPKLGVDNPKDPKLTTEEAIVEQIPKEGEALINNQLKSIDNGISAYGSIIETGDSPEKQVSASARALQSASLKDSVTTALDSFKTELSSLKSSAAQEAKNLLTKLPGKIGENIAKKAAAAGASKLVPIYGEVVMAAGLVVLNDWIGKNVANGKVFRLVAFPAGLLMAAQFSRIVGAASDAKLGLLDTRLVGFYAELFNGLEKSGLFNCFMTNWETGCEKNGESFRTLGETNAAFMQVMDTLKPIMQAANLLNPGGPAVVALAKMVLAIDNSIVGGIVTEIITAPIKMEVAKWQILADFALSALPPEQQAAARQLFNDSLQALIRPMTEGFSALMKHLFGLEDVNLYSGGDKAFSTAVGGSLFSSNRFGESLGMHAINLPTASQQTQAFLQENRDYAKSKGILYALFSPENTESVTNKLAMMTPVGGSTLSTPTNIASALANIVKGTPKSLSRLVSGNAYAGAKTYEAPEAIMQAYPVGITDEEANAPLNDAVFTGTACSPASAGGTGIQMLDDAGSAIMSAIEELKNTYTPTPFSNCALDTASAQAVACSIDVTITETSPECNPDISVGPCPTGTSAVAGISVGWDRVGTPQPITICAIPGTTMSPIPHWQQEPRYAGTSAASITNIAVSSVAAAKLLEAANKAQSEKVTLEASVGYRSLYEQCSITLASGNSGYDSAKCPSWITAVPGRWNTDTLYSNHMMGLSVDFTPTSQAWMASCQTNPEADGKDDNRCFGFYNDAPVVNGKSDAAHFTYDP